MYKERIKSAVNPIIATLIWLGATYLFTIVWGILQILFEFHLELAKYLVCIIETVWFGWFLINRVLTEYEAEIGSGKMRITKILSRRQSEVLIVALDNITATYKEKEKEKLKNHRIAKRLSFALPGQKHHAMYIVYNSAGKENCAYLKLSKKFWDVLKKEKHKERN